MWCSSFHRQSSGQPSGMGIHQHHFVLTFNSFILLMMWTMCEPPSNFSSLLFTFFDPFWLGAFQKQSNESMASCHELRLESTPCMPSNKAIRNGWKPQRRPANVKEMPTPSWVIRRIKNWHPPWSYQFAPANRPGPKRKHSILTIHLQVRNC